MGVYTKRTRRGNQSLSSYIGNGFENDPVSLLAAMIVVHAIDDWRQQIKCKAWVDDHISRYCSFDELRAFFKGEWCAFLMNGFALEPAKILEILEAELQEAMRKDNRRWKKKSG